MQLLLLVDDSFAQFDADHEPDPLAVPDSAETHATVDIVGHDYSATRYLASLAMIAISEQDTGASKEP